MRRLQFIFISYYNFSILYSAYWYCFLHKIPYDIQSMEIDPADFNERKEKTRDLYDAQKNIYNPYLKSWVVFNSDGFHHLQFSARRERNKKEQLLKFNLFPWAIGVIKNSGTLQQHKKELMPVGKKGKDGFAPTKTVEYWGFIAIVGKAKVTIKVVLRRIGDGNIIFLSVMPFLKLGGNQKFQGGGLDESEDE